MLCVREADGDKDVFKSLEKAVESLSRLMQEASQDRKVGRQAEKGVCSIVMKSLKACKSQELEDQLMRVLLDAVSGRCSALGDIL